MTPEAFEQAARGLLDRVPAMTLATCADALPWATDVYFAPLGYDLVFFSSPASRHCRNLAENQACAASVHPQAATWQEIRGLQLEGRAGPAATAAEKAQALAAYLTKFPFAKDLLANPAEAARTLLTASAHIFRPTRIRYLDNALGIGTRFCLRIQGGKPAGEPEREERG